MMYYLLKNAQLTYLVDDTYKLEEKAEFVKTLLPNTYVIILVVFILLVLTSAIFIYLFIKNKSELDELHQQVKRKDSYLLQKNEELEALEIDLEKMITRNKEKTAEMNHVLSIHKDAILSELKVFFRKHTSLHKYKSELEDIVLRGLEDGQKGKNAVAVELQEIHPQFYVRLQECADNKLTQLDLKYCCLIYKEVPSREMANILHVEPRTVLVTKYRLKRKFNLDKEEDLSYFIKRLI